MIKKKKIMKKISIFISAVIVASGFCGCSDFFDQESDHVIYSENHDLNNASDTIYSMTGILHKLQALADRTILLGEVRGDLVDITNTASSDLRDLSLFSVGDNNMYNAPRDYYAVINNCNFFIAHADTAKKNNRNEYIFMKEYAAIKAIRAWTYLQLVTNYGKVPFVVDPILTKEQSELDYPRYDIQAICEYFINDLLPLAEKYGRQYPGYGTIRSTDSRFFYFPINIVLGDLYLWAGSASGNVEYYKQSALRYYKYISERNGDNSTYPTGSARCYWPSNSTTWTSASTAAWTRLMLSEDYRDEELITMIPCDSIRAEGNYSELINIFNSRYDNDYKVSLNPSVRVEEISTAQDYCNVSGSGSTVTYAPKGLEDHMSGDLRLSAVWYQGYTINRNTRERVEYQSIEKYSSRNVHIYRRQMVYLRMAEALNMAGYPRMAFQILSQGLNNVVLRDEVYPYYSQSDSLFISQFDFPESRYIVMNAEDAASEQGRSNYNTIGLHTHGSGFTPLNEFYQLPVDTTKTEAEMTPIFQSYVDKLIIDESALEFAFEGTRYYDLMRYALRQPNPGQTFANLIYARRGEENRDIMKSEIKLDLTNQDNWFLKWTGMN